MRKEITNKTTNGNWAEMLLQPFFMDNTINALDSSQVDDILEARELAEKILKMRKLALNDEILMKVEKPARYIGNEVNSVMKNKDEVDIRFAFVRVFP